MACVRASADGQYRLAAMLHHQLATGRHLVVGRVGLDAVKDHDLHPGVGKCGGSLVDNAEIPQRLVCHQQQFAHPGAGDVATQFRGAAAAGIGHVRRAAAQAGQGLHQEQGKGVLELAQGHRELQWGRLCLWNN